MDMSFLSRNFIRDHRLRILMLSLIIAGGTFLRFHDLGGQSLSHDEATSFFVAQKDVQGIVREMIAIDTHPPLHYILLRYWLRFGDSEFAIRSLSALVGTASIPLIYLVAKTLFTEPVGLYSALLLAISPLHVQYSQEARMRVLATFFILLGTYFQLRLLRKERVAYVVLYITFMALSLYTFYFAVFAVFFQNLFMVYWFLSDRNHRGMLGRWLLIQAAILLLFLPWLPALFAQVSRREVNRFGDVFGPPTVSVFPFTLSVFSWGTLEPRWLKFIGALVFGLCLLKAIAPVRLKSQSLPLVVSWEEPLVFCLMYLLCPLLLVFLVSQLYPLYAVHYLLLFLPPYVMLIAKGIYALRGVVLRTVVVLLIIAISLLGIQAYRIQPKADWRELAHYILEHAQPDDAVVFDPSWWAKPFNYYARDSLAIPEWELLWSLGHHDHLDSFEDLRDQYRRLWFVWGNEHWIGREGQVKAGLDRHFPMMQALHFNEVGEIILSRPLHTKVH